jgi:DNA-binding NtrC family response regulator
MSRNTETQEERPTLAEGSPEGSPQPGLLLVFSAGEPMARALPLCDGEIEIGRDTLGALKDPLLSRRHAAVRFDGERFTVRDLGSRNGTAADGVALGAAMVAERAVVVRTGGTLFLLCADVRPLQDGVRVLEGTVVGPGVLAAWNAIARAARHGGSLHINGESGSGKELAARAFHRLGPNPSGPFVAVNCAAIPQGVAESLLFGARKGAYSGAAADSEGYLQAAHGGTLFLDEVAELDLQVQGKLLRALETREVLPLGATRPRAVDVRICSATHKDLRAQVAASRLREDFYFRIGRPQIDLLPLRRRLEEIPWLLDREVKRTDPGLSAHVSLVEACLLRPWPGNVRELLLEARTAAQAALDAEAREVKDQHLPPGAGMPFAPATAPDAPSPPMRSAPAAAEVPASDESGDGGLSAARIRAALAEHGGNVSRAARALELPSRFALYRLLRRHGIEVDDTRR